MVVSIGWLQITTMSISPYFIKHPLKTAWLSGTRSMYIYIYTKIYAYRTYAPKNRCSTWNTSVGRWLSFWEGGRCYVNFREGIILTTYKHLTAPSRVKGFNFKIPTFPPKKWGNERRSGFPKWEVVYFSGAHVSFRVPGWDPGGYII